MANNPLQFPRVFQDVRRARLHTFPYGLFYRIEPGALMVIACFHASRDPQRWQRRV
jgi:toxin ParE1/3/4